MSVFHSLSVVFWLLVISQARETGRSKRQSTVYYLCGNYPNQYVSQQPCAGSSAYTPSSSFLSSLGLNNNNNKYYYTTQTVLPASFAQPSSFCNRGCNTLNCNQYQGQWLGSQFVATNNQNQYSACASSCCRNNYAYNPLPSASIPAIGQGVSVGGFGYNYNSVGHGVNVNSIGNGVSVNPIGGGVQPGGRYPFGVMQYCGGAEQPSANCQNGVCPNGDVCTPGNVCCKCSVGSAAGPCVNNDCPAGYSCQQNGYCCATFVYNDGYKLNMCVNGACNPGFTCGKGGLCYPDTPSM